MTLDERPECQLGAVSGTTAELFEQLPVGQAADRPDLEEHLDMPERFPLPFSIHTRVLSRHVSHVYTVMSLGREAIPHILSFLGKPRQNEFRTYVDRLVAVERLVRDRVAIKFASKERTENTFPILP